MPWWTCFLWLLLHSYAKPVEDDSGHLIQYDTRCDYPMGLARDVSDAAFSSLNSYSEYWYPARAARLNGRNAWLGTSGGNWIQIDFGQPRMVTAISTQSGPWHSYGSIRKYKIKYGWNGVDFKDFNGGQLLSGNSPELYDRGVRTVTNPLGNGFVARFVRLYPDDWAGESFYALRMELIGCDGPKGKKGKNGEPGPLGPRGDQGMQGLAGDPGVAGQDGSRATQGPKGDTGAVGAKGPPGPPGLTGARGAPGAQGPTGPPGAVGFAGPVGLKGDPGAPGPMGPPGPQGDAGIAGAQGPKGLPGPAGPMGRDGRDGLNGLDGPPGMDGPRGDPGQPGSAGVIGPQGLKGERGAAGIAGNDGPIGPRGPKGDPGDQGLGDENKKMAEDLLGTVVELSQKLKNTVAQLAKAASLAPMDLTGPLKGGDITNIPVMKERVAAARRWIMKGGNSPQNTAQDMIRRTSITTTPDGRTRLQSQTYPLTGILVPNNQLSPGT